MPRRGILASWDNIRNAKEVHWTMECFAEMVSTRIPNIIIALTRRLSVGQLGVLLYVYFGKPSALQAGLLDPYSLQRYRVHSRLGSWKRYQGRRNFQYVLSCSDNDLQKSVISFHQIFYRSVSAIHSESFSLSVFVLQHQGGISIPVSPSLSPFSRSSLYLRLSGENRS